MENVKSITPNAQANFTPALGDYKTLQPFRYWCQRVLPLVYDDSLSYYELLCKVVDYLNKTMEDVGTLHGDVTNLHTAYEELQSYVNNYFSNLDVQEEINKKLDEMAQDGTLETIIDKLGLYSSSVLIADRLCRIVSDTDDYADVNINTALDWGQAICVVGDKILVSLYNSKRNINNVRLVEVNISGTNILRDITINNLGHCNWMCYNPSNNYVYVSVLTYNHSGEQTATSEIIVLDYSTLSVVNKFNAPEYTHSICYDKKTGNMFALCAETKVYSFDYTNNTFSLLYNLSLDYSYTLQGMSVYDNALYIVTTSPNTIISLDLAGNVKKLYSPNNWYDIYYFGELESVDFDNDGNIYLFSVTYTSYACNRFNQIWKSNLITGYLSSYSAPFTPVGETIHIDKKYAGLNPDGSSEKPFPYLAEGIIAYNGSITFSNITMATGTYKEFIYSNKNIVINGNNSTVICAILNGAGRVVLSNIILDNETSVENAVRAYYCGDVLLENINVKTVNGDPILCINSRLALSGTFTDNSNKPVSVKNLSAYPVRCNQNIDYKILDVYSSSGGTKRTIYCNITETNTLTLSEPYFNSLTNNVFTRIGFTIRSADVTTFQCILYTELYETNIPVNKDIYYDFGSMFVSGAKTAHFISGSVKFSKTGQVELVRLKEYYMNNGTLAETANKPILISISFE